MNDFAQYTKEQLWLLVTLTSFPHLFLSYSWGLIAIKALKITNNIGEFLASFISCLAFAAIAFLVKVDLYINTENIIGLIGSTTIVCLTMMFRDDIWKWVTGGFGIFKRKTK